MFIRSVTGLKVVPSWSKDNTVARSLGESALTRSSLLTGWMVYSGNNQSLKNGSFNLQDDPDAIPNDNEDILQDDDSELEDDDDDD